jgi:hypothetical protein
MNTLVGQNVRWLSQCDNSKRTQLFSGERDEDKKWVKIVA